MAKKKKAKVTRRKTTAKAAAKATKSTRSAPARALRGPKRPAKTAKGFQLTSQAPSLTVNDVAQSLAWYCDVLGFVIAQKWEREGKLVGAELKAGQANVYLSQEDGQQGERVKGQGFRIYWYSNQDIDQIAAGIKARGGTLASEPKDEWGMRYFNLVDPTGYKITIGTER
jgi:uncharacterized glyoxalase superfamily protein PhnB